MRVALAQINPTIGDFPENTARIVRAAKEAAGRGADVVVFPELALTGYPPRDLVEKPSFLDRSESELERVAQETADLGLSIICGFVARSQAETGKRALNSAALIERGKIVFRQSKMLLPTYDVFDEARYFRPAERAELCALGGRSVALTICEDA
jgi:NAD+ synthase (glutamine-hydrolysing)